MKREESITKKAFLFCFMAMAVFVPNVYSESYYNFTDDHLWIGDYQGGTALCWAAAASNVLAWTGWGMSDNPQTIFQDFQSHWPDEPGDPTSAIMWYFNGGDYPGGDYYPDVNVWDVLSVSYSGRGLMDSLKGYIDDKHGVDILVQRINGGTGHALTVWGYETDATGQVDGLYVTNSWYETPVLEEIDVWPVQGAYYLWYTDFFPDGYISGVVALDQVNGVCEPFTVLLFGMGLVGLVVCKRTFEN